MKLHKKYLKKVNLSLSLSLFWTGIKLHSLPPLVVHLVYIIDGTAHSSGLRMNETETESNDDRTIQETHCWTIYNHIFAIFLGHCMKSLDWIFRFV